MKTAKAYDWKTEPLPEKRTVIRLNLAYANKDRQKIVKGFIPEQMEDKWFVYYEQGVLNFHRSWTGYCIYRAFANDNGREINFTHAEVNRDREQYSETDVEADIRMIPHLIDILFLERPTHFFPGHAKETSKTDFIRIIPVQRFTGSPAPSHRPYAFYTDAASILGKSVAESYLLVKGLNLPPMESGRSHCTPFIWDHQKDIDGPLVHIKVKKNQVLIDEMPQKKLAAEKFVVLRVSRSDALNYLDVFPATWKALSYIVSDPVRMRAREPGWGMSPDQYASARIHALFREVQDDDEIGLLASKESKERLGLCDLDRLSVANEEGNYYAYLSRDSALTNNIVELFGISSRCWHGCGYIGSPGKPICRFYLLQNHLPSCVMIFIMKGKDILE